LNGNQDIELLTRPQPLIADSSDPWQVAAGPSFKKLLHVFADSLALVAGYAATTALLSAGLRGTPQHFDVLRHAFFLPFVLVVLHLFGAYGSDLRRPDRELEVLFKGTTVGFGALFLGLSVLTDGSLWLTAYFVALWWVATLFSLACARFSLRFVYGALWRRGLARTRVLLMGSPEPFLIRERWLSFQKHTSYEVVGAIPSDAIENADGIADSASIHGDAESWVEMIEACQVSTVAFDLATFPARNDAVSAVVKRCERAGIEVMFFDSRENGCKGDCEYDPATQMHTRSLPSPRVQMMTKRLIDIFFGVAGSLVTLLLTPVIGLLINLEDPGPVFHRREFVSEDGSLKYYLKFRTMLRNADDILENDPHLKARFVGNYKLQQDPRVLRIGRFLRKYSIDEFPQFFSLLTNKLTLVGPRVICEAEKDRYGDLLPKRLSVKPGITGYWQVMGRQTTTYEERVRLDIFYIDQWSIWLDLVIIAKTFATIIRPQGAY
jgi:lipopolysaccharide/colanic/teichoic acid biosynthesis glycosyltransferase